MKSVLLAIALAATVMHDVHVSTARIALDANSAFMRVRLFHDDLQNALRKEVRRPDYTLEVTPKSDSVVIAYLNRRFALIAGGRALKPMLIGSGEEKGMKPELNIWYFDVKFELPRRLEQIEIRNELLFESFRDQSNIVKILLPSGKEKTIFFVPGGPTYKLELKERRW